MNLETNDCSITTGSIATATALSGLQSILTNENIAIVEISTPTDIINVEIKENKKVSKNIAKSIAVKYPYNDPDVTINLEIVATVELLDKVNDETVIITGGKGIGKVTKPGLQVAVGDYAINPIPLKMIRKNLEPLIPEGKSVKVEISAPEGEEIAKKTMNPKLGIIGGISIIGTTGIARSMSSKAYKDSIAYQIDVAIAQNLDNLVFTPGNIGEGLAQEKLKVSKDQIIQTGNYVGFMFNNAYEKGLKEFTYFGHIGKLVKVAGGIFNTKHSVADGRREIVITYAALNGASRNVLEEIYESKTTDDMFEILNRENLSLKVSNDIAKAIKNLCKSQFDIDLNVILVDMTGHFLNENFNLNQFNL
ncbi:cobalt-precorrin-5B (C(1))-methyltransferase CbiD [Methanobrevibacter sp. DSM 116169]|uniref:cobalt-precorrin-5B (C(1))-methyltransferase CbiD n=1 Tax=Methanobrevibacter sp. DSM 116169 TaxID=3242727 RepID=UPI0038FCEFC2